MEHSVKFIRRRRFIMMLPLLTAPFITILVWALVPKAEEKKAVVQQAGVNTALPGAHLKDDRRVDKMALYEEAEVDSIRRGDRLKSEAIYGDRLKDSGSIAGSAVRDRNEERVKRKLSELRTVLEKGPGAMPGSEVAGAGRGTYGREDRPVGTKANAAKGVRPLDAKVNGPAGEKGYRSLDAKMGWSADKGIDGAGNQRHSGRELLPADEVDRLESMMHAMKGGGEENGELREMNGVLDKLLLVQHPEKMSSREQDSALRSSAGHVGEIHRAPDAVVDVSFLPSVGKDSLVLVSRTGSFYGWEDSNGDGSSPGGMSPGHNVLSIEAVLPVTEVLVNGSTVKLELAVEARVDGVVLPAGTGVYGVASLHEERLSIRIRSIRSEGLLLPVELEAYDADGLEGIYVPGAITRDAVKQSADQGLNSLGMASFDPGIGAQAASAGMQLAKSMLSRKVRLVRVAVAAGYHVWLKESKGN